MKEELPTPLYFSFHGITSVLKMTAPKYQEVWIIRITVIHRLFLLYVELVIILPNAIVIL